MKIIPKDECSSEEWGKQGWHVYSDGSNKYQRYTDFYPDRKKCMNIHILSPYRTAYDAIVARQSDGSEVGVSTNPDKIFGVTNPKKGGSCSPPTTQWRRPPPDLCSEGGGEDEIQGENKTIEDGTRGWVDSDDKWQNALTDSNPPKFKALKDHKKILLIF